MIEQTLQIIGRWIKSTEALNGVFVFLSETDPVRIECHSPDKKTLITNFTPALGWGAWEEQEWPSHWDSFLIILIILVILHLGLGYWFCLPLLWQPCLMKTSFFSMRHCFSIVLMKTKFCKVLYVKEIYVYFFLHHYQCTFLWCCL